MKQIYILIEKSEINNITDFYDRKEMQAFEAANLNGDLIGLFSFCGFIVIMLRFEC